MLQHVRVSDARDHKGNDVLNRPAFHLQTAYLRTSNGQTAGHGQTAGSSKQIRLALLRMVLGALGLLVGLATTLPAQANMIRDTEIEAGVDELIAPLINVAGFAPEAIDVRIILDNRVNAFVQSKRTIYVHSGLIESAEDPLLFLGVMAHELAHLKAGHVQQIDEALGQAGTAAALATIAAVAIAAGGHGDAAAGVLVGGTDRANRNILSSVRRNEAIADELGLAFLDDAGISAAGLRDMMARMARQRALPESRQSQYYSTHPGTAQRLQTYQDHVNSSPHSDTKPSAELAEKFRRIKAKLNAWTERPQTVLNGNGKGLDPDLQTYAHAIAAFRRGDLNGALERIDSLIETQPQDPFFHEFRGDILMSMAQPSAAAAAYETAISLRPNSPQIELLLGRALIATGDRTRLPRAIEVISSARTGEPKWAFLHRQLGIAYGRAGQINHADLSLADEAILRGDTIRAVQLAKRTLGRGDLSDALRNRANDIIYRYEPKN